MNLDDNLGKVIVDQNDDTIKFMKMCVKRAHVIRVSGSDLQGVFLGRDRGQQASLE